MVEGGIGGEGVGGVATVGVGMEVVTQEGVGTVITLPPLLLPYLGLLY